MAVRPITDYLQHIRSLSDELATTGAPVAKEELYEKMIDHELFVKHEDMKKTPTPITTAIAQKNNFNNKNNRHIARVCDLSPTIILKPEPTSLQVVRLMKTWILNSGSSYSVTAQPHNLQGYESLEEISVGDGKTTHFV
ncbi:hypothetical protein ACH5RR_032960 [Cinchona calisaya]|uniref:Uncharacterized protein n=1 Tax=Cinchona calisaya TaxID=153742 RepID=A0ABD2YKR9_9GENT